MFFDTTIDISFFSCNVNSYIEKNKGILFTMEILSEGWGAFCVVRIKNK